MSLESILNSNYSHADRDAETFAFLGGALLVGKLVIPQPTAGVFAYLEQLESPYLVGGECNVEGVSIALYCLINRENLLNTEVDISDIVTNIEDIQETHEMLEAMFNRSMDGFRTIPSKNVPESNQRTFEAEWLAMITSVVCNITNATAFEAIWRVPMTAVGFYMASYAKEQGVKGVGRQKDYVAALEYLKRKREKNGT